MFRTFGVRGTLALCTAHKRGVGIYAWGSRCGWSALAGLLSSVRLDGAAKTMWIFGRQGVRGLVDVGAGLRDVAPDPGEALREEGSLLSRADENSVVATACRIRRCRTSSLPFVPPHGLVLPVPALPLPPLPSHGHAALEETSLELRW